MQISNESYRTRWLILVSTWCLAAVSLFFMASTVRDYLGVANQLGLRGAAEAPTPLKHVYVAFAADAQTWVRHSIALTEGHDLQLRHTTIDNAPDGREVHWNSAWAWTIAGAGYIYHLFTGVPLPNGIENATTWLTPCVLLVLGVILSAWVTKRGGVIAGVVVIAAMIGNDRIYEGFFPGYADHHGLLTVSVFGMMLGAVFMGAGWWRTAPADGWPMLPTSPEMARSAAVFSAMCGACGLWVSAASVIPPVALVGAAGLIALVIQGRAAQSQGAAFDGQTWRIWGRVGAVASFFFYLLEYFPHHLGLRMEVNHPFYALAWFGGGELIAAIGERWVAPREERFARLHELVIPLLAVCVAPATILIGGAKVMIPADTFLYRLHNDYIQEFLPIWRTVRGFEPKVAFQLLLVDNLPLVGGIATITYFRRETPLVVWFATLAALFFNVMAWIQIRWMLNASGVQVALAIVLLGCWTQQLGRIGRWVAALVLVFTLYVPTAVMRYTGGQKDVAARRVSPADANNALARDIARTLRESQPQGEITMLASPNASTSIGYYGRFKTLGTLYWENVDGLKSAAAIYSAATEDEAAALLRKHKVTHIAIISQENFIEQYNRLLHPNVTDDQIRHSFGYRLFVDRVVPQWLEMLPYRVPDDLKSLNQVVMLFKVNFNQTLPEAVFNVAKAQMVNGDVAAAEQALDAMIKIAPQIYQGWIQKGNLLLLRHAWSEAADALLRGISLAPAAEKPSLYVTSGSAFYTAAVPQYELAIKVYRTAIKDLNLPEAKCYLAWMLATCQDDKLRNGKEALQLAEEALRERPKWPSALSAVAAAHAELGQFREAQVMADQALATSKSLGEPATTVQVYAEQLATVKSGKPLRK